MVFLAAIEMDSSQRSHRAYAFVRFRVQLQCEVTLPHPTPKHSDI